MGAFAIFSVVFVTLVSSLCTALLVPFRQYGLRVEPRFFKRIKVKFPSFLFVGIGSKKSEQSDVRNFGVIIPMFVLHIVGYLLTLLIWAIVPALYYRVGVDLDVLVLIPLAIAIPFVIAVVITEYVCVWFSGKKKHEEEHTEENQHVETDSLESVPSEEQPKEQQSEEVQQEETHVDEVQQDEQADNCDNGDSTVTE